MGRKIGYKHSEESKEKMKEAAIKQIESKTRKGLFTVGHKRGMIGKHHSKLTISKIRNSNIGKNKGRIGFWKDKKNKYLTERNLKNNPMNNIKTRIKVSNSKQGIHYSKETEFKNGDPELAIRVNRLRREGKIIVPKKDTTIEVKIQNYLKQLGIEFVTHQYIKESRYGYQCDIFIPVQKGILQKTVIECDGDYWHGNLEKFNPDKLSQNIKERRCLDYERTAQLEEAGFRVIRLWENKIRSMELNDLQLKLVN